MIAPSCAFAQNILAPAKSRDNRPNGQLRDFVQYIGHSMNTAARPAFAERAAVNI
jgi:hypothetical protein